ncbi:hypothetical protein [Phytoactinopolyspora limicola]|uniref:hypothetical protein n=1 Tax=Phytoactinopolyspora limicola TaxID=2715536 RepID=UPI00140AC6E5|nr:hypothetical protein [Phytoactinopolyspora limicola]
MAPHPVGAYNHTGPHPGWVYRGTWPHLGWGVSRNDAVDAKRGRRSDALPTDTPRFVHLIAHRPRHETRSDAAPTALTSSVVASVHLIVATKKIR